MLNGQPVWPCKQKSLVTVTTLLHNHVVVGVCKSFHQRAYGVTSELLPREGAPSYLYRWRLQMIACPVLCRVTG